MSRMVKVATVALGTSAMVLGGAGLASADTDARAAAIGSPGFLSGNVVQVPIHVPINVCGNTVNIVGLLNPAFGNTCINDDHEEKKDDKKDDGKNKKDDGKGKKDDGKGKKGHKKSHSHGH
ncbi:chaplin [Streptomyces sp. CA-210063]|uniref:chaplin n=1 Tax=Streptomyces sp. CA-210063 TaxID=2801029 RepID=UPI0027D469F5|nr:chaplin [Streptomyces sp. CA-210063]